MKSYAQTNIQLYNQLSQAGWNTADLRQVHAAYQQAVSLFFGHFRPNQKPFLAHLVGTASILAATGAKAKVVATGLLHSAYSHGEFGDGSRGITERKRRQILGAVGGECEAMIAHYTTMNCGSSGLASLLADVSGLSEIDAIVAHVKLADALEDHLDDGMRYSPNKCLTGDPATHAAWCTVAVQLASALGHEALAAELATARRPSRDSDIPEFLLGERSGSFMVAPVSHRLRTSVRVGRIYRRWRARVAAARSHLPMRASL